ncbi:MAG TPA: FecR domain-containing protein [Bryobacteraceae bacterium]|nr:FecR domain-containing protein [Bryobacteraceae bacterium]
MTPTENNPAELGPMDPLLEQAVSEIRDEAPDPAVIEAAASRVWARLSSQVAELPATNHHIRGCADFQALIPDYRAGSLPQARATLLKDHLNQCVTCRKFYEGKVLPMPAPRPAKRVSYPVRWAAAAVVVAAAGVSIWIAIDQFGTPHPGHAIVQTVNGALYEVSAAGIRPIAAGQDLPDGIELRTAPDSDAMLLLRDGSLVELRERSGVSTTQAGNDLTIRLARGSVIVQAAKRRTGHLYVATADCRVAVTGTVFSVSSGIKGSRVSVIQGEVHVSQNNQEKILHPGEQAVTSPSLEPVAVKDDIAWSRNRDRLLQQLAELHSGLQQIHLPALRYSSRLLGRLPASTVFLASIPNLSQYLGEAQSVLHQKMAESPELRAWWAGRGINAEPVIEKLRAASEYLGDEIVIVGADTGEGKRGPVFLAETRRDGFAEFLKKEAPELTVEVRPGLAAFGPVAAAVKSLADSLDSPNGFQTTPFYARVSESFRDGAGLLLAADLSRMSGQPAPAIQYAPGVAPSAPNLAPPNAPAPDRAAMLGARYLIAEKKEVNGETKASASLEFNGPRTGIAAMLAEPAPMGSLDYVSPDATIVTAFAVKSSADIVNQVMGTVEHLPMVPGKARADVDQQASQDIRNEVAAALGGEFSLSLDGAPFPVPSWKLVTEVYDPGRLQAALQKLIEAHDQAAAKTGDKPLRTSHEDVDGRTFYMIASGDLNPLTEVHYTFADGYMIAGPSRALISRALQMKMAGTSITHSAQFIEMTPRDHYSHFSALIYEKLGTTLAPLAGLLGAFAPQAGGSQDALKNLSNIKPMMIAAYGEPDRITIAGAGDLSSGMSNLMGGNLLGALGNVGNAVPFMQFQGTPRRQPAFK